jgi:hypothetical protein
MKKVCLAIAALALVLAAAGSLSAAALSFTLAADMVGPGSPVKVTFSEALPKSGEKYWITIIPAGTPDSEWGEWQYVSAGVKSLDLNAPAGGGAYEVRLHAQYPAKSSNVVCRRPLTVGGASAPSAGAVSFTLANAALAKGEKPKVTFSAPIPVAGGRYWITVVAAGAADSDWGEWQYLDPGSREVELAAPAKAGSYEVRLHDNYPAQSNHVIHREPLTVK